jgi:hypothetical protein
MVNKEELQTGTLEAEVQEVNFLEQAISATKQTPR